MIGGKKSKSQKEKYFSKGPKFWRSTLLRFRRVPASPSQSSWGLSLFLGWACSALVLSENTDVHVCDCNFGSCFCSAGKAVIAYKAYSAAVYYCCSEG